MSSLHRPVVRRVVVCAVVLIAAAVSLGLVQRTKTPAVETLLPQNAILYIGWDGNDAHREAWQKTAAYEALYQSGCVEFIGKVLSLASTQAPPEAAELAKGLFDTVSNHGLSLAVALPGSGGPPLPYAVVVVPDAASLEPAIARTVQQLTGRELEWNTDDVVSRRRVTRAMIPDSPGVEVGWWTEGSHLVIAAGINAIQAATAIADGQAPNITTSSLWKKYRVDAQLDYEPTTLCWLDLGQLRSSFSDMALPAPKSDGQPLLVKDLVDIFGLGQAGAIVSRSGYQGRAVISETLFEAPAPRKGLLALLDQPPMRLEDLPPLPPDSNGLYASSFDWSAAYDAVVATVHELARLAPPNESAQMEGMLAQAPTILGFDPKTELCDALGNVCCVYNDPGQGFMGFGFGLAIEVDQPDRLRTTVNQLLARAAREAGKDFRVDRVHKQGRELLMFTFAQTMTIGALAIDKDWMIVGLSPQSVESFLLRLDGKLDAWKPSRLQQEALDAAPKQFSSLAISDPRGTYRMILGYAPFMFAAAQEQMRKALRSSGPTELPVTIADIPPADLVVGPLFPNIAVSTVDEHGIHCLSRTSLPGIPLIGGIGGGASVATTGVLVALLLPAVQSAREAARRTQSKNNLKQIAIALHNYHDVYRSFPAGTHPNPQLAPDKRLSWMTDILPFLEQSALHDTVDFGKGWDDQANERPLTSKIIVFQNPGQPQEPQKYATTHYVGIAGVGEDAPTLPVTSNRAGAFGYYRALRIRDILDGTSNTMGVTEASKNFGPWGAGGPATIRALTRQPYVNGPDGIGGPYRGGLNIMLLDGSVRFVSENIDPEVFKALATIRGGERGRMP